MVNITIDKPTVKELALTAMLEAGIYDKETYSKASHLNNPDDEIHRFWDKFADYLQFFQYEIQDCSIKKNCKTCKYSSPVHIESDISDNCCLYKCLNTEFNMSSNNSENFSCCKWEGKY